MALSKYFRFPFGLTGDRAVIPDAVQPSGEVSFEEGYSIDYQLNPATEPSAKNIERDKANQLYYDITKSIKEYQEFGAPYWIEAAQNGGVAFPYPKYALVRYDIGAGVTPIFQSLVAANTALPTVTANWKQLTSAESFVTENATFEASVTNGEVVYWDNANNRFDEAIADGTAAQNAVGIADVTNARVILFGSLPSGLLTGLAANVPYYLSTTTPGAITSAVPTSNVVRIGTSKSATTFVLNIVLEPTHGTTQAQFDNDNSLATTAFVQRSLGNMQGQVGYNTSQAIPGARVGTLITFNASSLTLTLPSTSNVPTGSRFIIYGNSFGGIIAKAAGDMLFNGTSGSITNFTVGAYDRVELVSIGGAGWYVMGGEVALKSSTSFLSHLAASGYQQLPSGLIIQWGAVTNSATIGNPTAVTFPIAFPNAVFTVDNTAINAATANSAAWFDTPTVNGFNSRVAVASLASRWFAIGY